MSYVWQQNIVLISRSVLCGMCTRRQLNICYQVVFTDGLQWIVRVPKPGRSMYMEEKVRGEVAAIKYIKLNTSIPVPDIIAFGVEFVNRAN